jgi:Poly(ADP-ribose) polymerase catalytic domain
VKQLALPRLTFHGTRRKYVGSIVRYGFLKPGDRMGSTDESLEVRCGGAYGRGIYSSPSASFSITYVGSSATAVRDSDVSSVRLIVCAAIMGRAATLSSDDNWRSHGQPYPNSDSHIASEFEYAVFHASQILPCYVTHLDWGSKEARRVLEKVPNNPSVWVKAQARKRNKTHPKLGRDILYPSDKVRSQAAKQAAATKWFPFSYGPAKGTSFKIEEIGEVSDEKEEYGTYQKDVVAKCEYSKEADDRDHKGTYWFDEYYLERTTKCDLKKGVETELKIEVERFAHKYGVASEHSCDEHGEACLSNPRKRFKVSRHICGSPHRAPEEIHTRI